MGLFNSKREDDVPQQDLQELFQRLEHLERKCRRMETRISELENAFASQSLPEKAEDLQLVILGTGDEKYENMFHHYDWKYNNKVRANIYYSEELSHKIYGSCDAFLMPSLFEPCGLSQLMALRYGTVPIVRETGGLKDTVEPYNEYEGRGTGFSFRNYNAHEMLNAIRYADGIYKYKKREWNKIIERGMKADFSWEVSAHKYSDMYDWLIG